MKTVANDHSFQQDETGLSRVEYAYRKLKQNITTNIFPSGFQMLEPELAEKLGVSRTPVREALIRLEADKLIQLIPRRGMRVLPIAHKDIVEVIELIASLQVTAVKSICDSMSSASLESMHLQIDIMQRSIAEDNKEAWVTEEDKFILAMVNVTGNARLKALVKNLLEQVSRAKYVILDFVPDRTFILHHHVDLLNALIDKNQVLALTAVESHQRETVQLFSDVRNKYKLKEF